MKRKMDQRFVVSRILICLMAAGLFLSPTASAGALVNGGFENGDMMGWTVTARDITRYSVGGAGSPPLPAEGAFFAVLVADVQPYTELSQQISMAAGDILSGYAYYEKWIISDQEAYVRVFDGLNSLVEQPWYRSAAGSSAWETWTFTASAADTYTLVLGVREPSGHNMHSRAFFDGVPHTVVPEPAAISLLALSGLVAIRRSRRA